jgi:serine protease Do
MWREGMDNRVFDRVPMQGNVFATNAARPKLGIAVQDTDDGKGVKVLEADEDGTAAKAGIKKDDVITHIDDKAVNGADEISKLMREKKDQPVVRFQVNRGGKSQTIEVKIPRKLKTVDL